MSGPKASDSTPRVLLLTVEQVIQYGSDCADTSATIASGGRARITPLPASLTCATCRWWRMSVALGKWHGYGCGLGVNAPDTNEEDVGCCRTDCKPEDHATDFGCVKWEARA